MLFHASSIFVLSNANFAKIYPAEEQNRLQEKNPTGKIHVGYTHTRLQRNLVLSDD
jgi:hypothetical protein